MVSFSNIFAAPTSGPSTDWCTQGGQERTSLPSPGQPGSLSETRLHRAALQLRLPPLFSTASVQSQTLADLQDHQNPSSPILRLCLTSLLQPGSTHSANIYWVPTTCKHGAGCWECGNERLPTLKELTSAFLEGNAWLAGKGSGAGVRVDKTIIVLQCRK